MRLLLSYVVSIFTRFASLLYPIYAQSIRHAEKQEIINIRIWVNQESLMVYGWLKSNTFICDATVTQYRAWSLLAFRSVVTDLEQEFLIQKANLEG